MQKFIISENFLCLATILEMILNDIGIDQYNRFDIASELGIILPLSDDGWIEGAIYSDNVEKWGIPFSEKRLNDYFIKRDIPLHADYVFATPYTVIADELEPWKGSYIVFLLSYGECIGNMELIRYGHALLYLGRSDEKSMKIYDPGPDSPGAKTISSCVIEEAMYQRKGGYIRIKKIE